MRDRTDKAGNRAGAANMAVTESPGSMMNDDNPSMFGWDLAMFALPLLGLIRDIRLHPSLHGWSPWDTGREWVGSALPTLMMRRQPTNARQIHD